MHARRSLWRGLSCALAVAVIPAAGSAWAEDAGGETKNNPVMLFPILKKGKWGYMDEKGDVKIEPQYDQAFDFSEGMACVVTYPWRGYINRAGKMVIEPQFTWAGPFREGLAPVRAHWVFYGRHANYYGSATSRKSIDVKNRIKRSCFVNYSGTPMNGVPFSTSGVVEGKVLLTSKQGTRVYGIDGKEYKHDANKVCQFSDGLAAARKGNRWGYVDHSLKWVIEPRFDEADGFFEGLAAVMKADPPAPKKADYLSMRKWQAIRKVTWGFIDKNGESVIDYRFEDVWRFSEGLASVRVNGPSTGSTGSPQAGSGQGKWGYIDKKGAVVIQPAYDYAWPFAEGMGRVMVGEKQGFIDKEGAVVIQPKYRPAWEFSKGLARVQIKDADGFREGYINKKGETIWEPTK